MIAINYKEVWPWFVSHVIAYILIVVVILTWCCGTFHSPLQTSRERPLSIFFFYCIGCCKLCFSIIIISYTWLPFVYDLVYQRYLRNVSGVLLYRLPRWVSFKMFKISYLFIRSVLHSCDKRKYYKNRVVFWDENVFCIQVYEKIEK